MMQLFDGMLSTVAWSVATTVLLTMTATALPMAPLDGSMHSRSDETGLLMRRTDRPFSPVNEDMQSLAQSAYSQCLQRLVGVPSPGLDM